MRPLPSVVEIAPTKPLHPLQEEQWTHRSPYIYVPSENKIFWGWPGTFHGDLAQDVRAKHRLPLESRDTLYGSVYQHPLDPTQYAHSLHSWARERDPYEEERLGQTIGVPVNPYVGPEWLQDDFRDEDWTHWMTPGVGMMRSSMADRSGHPEIDQMIEEFLQTPMGDWTTDTDSIEALRDPRRAHGSCEEVTEQFVAFAKERGFTAYVTQTDLDEMGYKPTGDSQGDVLNDQGEIVPGHYPEHTVASIYLPDQSWPVVVDFTATQYGYTDHPKVSKTSMAERSGDPQLDALIEEFIRDEDQYLTGGGDPGRADYRNPSDAEGHCADVAEYFTLWLSERGVSAEPYDGITHSGIAPTPEFNYHEAPIGGHSATIVETSTGRFLVDWTAAQFGYKEFPMVQKLNDGGWQREWQSKTAMGLRGDLPEGLTFQVTEYNNEDPDQFSDDIDAVGTPSGMSVEAYLGSQWIGHLTIDDHGVIQKVWVEEPYKRMGVATAMHEHLKQLGVKPEHNWGEMSPEGEAWADKTAATQVMYHVAPRSARESIQQYGLDWRLSNVLGGKGSNVLAATYEIANAFADFYRHAEPQPFDIWAVNVEGLQLQGDPDYDTDRVGDAFTSPDPIPPDRLHLLGPQEPSGATESPSN